MMWNQLLLTLLRKIWVHLLSLVVDLRSSLIFQYYEATYWDSSRVQTGTLNSSDGVIITSFFRFTFYTAASRCRNAITQVLCFIMISRYLYFMWILLFYTPFYVYPTSFQRQILYLLAQIHFEWRTFMQSEGSKEIWILHPPVGASLAPSVPPSTTCEA